MTAKPIDLENHTTSGTAADWESEDSAQMEELYPGSHRAITMQFPGRGFCTHTSAPRWPAADALLYAVLETYARSRADMGQVSTSRTVFSYREPAKIG